MKDIFKKTRVWKNFFHFDFQLTKWKSFFVALAVFILSPIFFLSAQTETLAYFNSVGGESYNLGLPVPLGIVEDETPVIKRSYFYENLSQRFTVNKDTSVDVEETQTYNFVGGYNKGWRSIPLKDVSDIVDVRVYDISSEFSDSENESGFSPVEDRASPLRYSPSRLEKTLPSSWGNYTYRKVGGNLEIEWYFDAEDTTRTWVLRYRLIGALNFLKDQDELYWNLLTAYEAPIKKVEAVVILPENNLATSSLQSEIYVKDVEEKSAKILDNRNFYFSAKGVEPKGIVTIAAGWPKGLINRSAFWRQFLETHYVAVCSFSLVFVTVLVMVLYWYFTEKRNRGRGLIIPEYGPPSSASGRIPPAMAELIVKERLSPKAWAATIIDLAVRGYVKISEEKAGNFLAVLRLAAGLIIPVFLVFFIGFSVISDLSFFSLIFIVPIIFMVIRFYSAGGVKESLVPKDYVIEQIKSPEGDSNLHDYEKSFLYALFYRDKFSTKEMRRDKRKALELYKAMREIQEKMYKETEMDTGAYEKPISKEKYWTIGILAIVFLAFFLIPLSSALAGSYYGWLVIILVAAICALTLWLFVKFEARLSAEGVILREEWLGFKMYLEKAEKYRMQNLTPELFEKYLPYAIIFGVEKKWGKAFEGISTQPPNWLAVSGVEPYHGVGTANNFSSGFSASTFSASFASSFSSAFASSGGGGASGGGGGAGGGGGGGGGGAS